MDIIKLLEDKASRFPEKPAFIFKDQQVTFLGLRDAVFKLANSFKKLGVRKSDKVAIYLPNGLEYIYSYLAVWCCGATAVPLDFMLTEDELVSCILHSEAKLIILRPKVNIAASILKEKCPQLKDFVICHGKNKMNFPSSGGIPLQRESFEELLSSEEKEFFPDAEILDKDYAIIFYTSGTTGRPKGVLINYLQLSAPPKSMEYFVDLNEKDITVCALPFSHLGGLIYIQNCIYYGITVVLMERFVPLEFLKNVEHYKITCFWIVPSMYYAFLQLKEFESFNLSSLRWMVTFGASNSPDALRRFNQYCPGAHLLNGWGLTETNAPTVVLPLDSEKIESVGRPLPWVEVKIFPVEGERLLSEPEASISETKEAKEFSQGDVGEIAVRGWVVTDGYYKDPEATMLALRDGWFYTGDLGRFDPEGYLCIVGRKKEMIKVGGELVFEPEVEAVIQKHPGVFEAAVIGVADNLRGEVPKVYIVLKEGQSASEEDLRYFCRKHLAHFKIPHYFEFVDSLQKNRAGKIDKEVLRKKKSSSFGNSKTKA